MQENTHGAKDAAEPLAAEGEDGVGCRDPQGEGGKYEYKGQTVAAKQDLSLRKVADADAGLARGVVLE